MYDFHIVIQRNEINSTHFFHLSSKKFQLFAISVIVKLTYNNGFFTTRKVYETYEGNPLNTNCSYD